MDIVGAGNFIDSYLPFNSFQGYLEFELTAVFFAFFVTEKPPQVSEILS